MQWRRTHRRITEKISTQISSILSVNNWLEQQQSTILSAATIITIATVLSALSGLVVKRTLISLFFTDPANQQALEAFWVAFQVPDMMFQLIILGALSAAFIPIFTEQKQLSHERAFRMSSIMMNLLLLIFFAIGTAIFIFARPITVWRTGAEFTPLQIDVVTNLTRIMLIAQFFFGISNFLSGMLQAFQRFIMPAIAPIVYNLGILLGVLFFHQQLGIYAGGVGVVVGAFLHMAIQLPLAWKLGFRPSFSLDISFPGITEFFTLMPPRIFAIGANEVRKLLLGFFATDAGQFGFLIMHLALTLMVIPIRFCGVPISQASLPFLTEESSQEKLDRFRGLVLQSLHQIAFLAYPASVLLLILRLPAVRLVFGTANFPWEQTRATAQLVAFLAISVTAQALVQLLIRAFYALKDTITPLMVSVFDVFLYAGLVAGLLYFTSLGVTGIAIATSITALIELLLYLGLLHYKIGGFMGKAFWIPQFKMLTAAFLMAVFLYLPYQIFDELVFNSSRVIDLIGLTVSTGTIGMLVYVYFAMLFDIRELQMFLRLIDSFGPWQQTLAQSNEVIGENVTDSGDAI